MDASKPKAVVGGAGVCGPVAAIALHRAGIHATVYEAYPQGGPNVGSYLTVASNGFSLQHPRHRALLFR